MSRRTRAGATRRPIDYRRIAQALKAFDAAQERASARATSILQIADLIASSAVEREVTRLIRALDDSGLLRALVDLQGIFGRECDQLPSDLQPLRHVPEAVLNWLREHLALTPHLERGKVLEVPAGRLAQFAILPAVEPRPGSIVTIRILEVGWKQQEKVSILPRAEIIP